MIDKRGPVECVKQLVQNRLREFARALCDHIEQISPQPSALHPTPYSLRPTPYTPHPSPYTLHPTPYTQMRGATCDHREAVLPLVDFLEEGDRAVSVSGICFGYMFRAYVPGICSGFRVLGFGIRDSGFGCLEEGDRAYMFRVYVPDSGFRVSGFGFRVSGAWRKVTGPICFGYMFRIPGFGFRVSGFGFRVPGGR